MKKKIRTKGKLQFHRYFQDLEKGDSVTIIKELAVKSNFPVKLQGKTGLVEGKRGKAYIVRIKDKNKVKRFLIEAIHLKKMNASKIK